MLLASSRLHRALRICALLCLLAALHLTITWPVGAEPGVVVTGVGWDGTVVPGTWSPVRVQVSDAAPASGYPEVRARVEIVMKSRFQPGPQANPVEFPTGAFGQDVVLSPGVTKELVIWVPSDYGYGPNNTSLGLVRLSVDGRTLAEQPIEFRAVRNATWPLIGVLAEAPEVARAIEGIELPLQGLPVPLTVARLTPSNLPGSPESGGAERLRALAAIVVQGNVAANLTGEQRETIRDWLQTGGHLVIAGGPQAVRAAAVLPPGVLTISFGPSESADLGPLARWLGRNAPSPGSGPVARFHVPPEGNRGAALVGSAEAPLVWRGSVGQGTVTILAADPALQPLVGWPAASALWQRALEPALGTIGDEEKAAGVRAQGRDSALRLQNAVDALPPEAFPSWQTVALILGGFALLVGPVLHLLLWRLDRREWLWLAVPAAALLLSGALYYVGIGREGRDVLQNVVTSVQIDPGGRSARQQVAAGFFAPTHETLVVGVPGDPPLRVTTASGPGRYGAYYGYPGLSGAETTRPPYHVISGRDTRIEFTGGEWNTRAVMLERTLGPEVGAISAQLGLEDGLIKGTVRNDTPYPIEDAAVVLNQTLVKLGSLAPGQTVPVTLDPGPPADPTRGYQSLSWRLFGRPREGSGGGYATAPVPGYPLAGAALFPSASVRPMIVGGPGMEQLELPQEPEIQRRVRLMDSVLNVAPRGPGPGMSTTPLTFVGFTRAPVGQNLPRAQRRVPAGGGWDNPLYTLTLLQQPLRLELPPGRFTMPPGLVPVELLNTTSRSGVPPLQVGVHIFYQLESGTAVYGYRPPLPAGARAEALTITTRQVGPPVPVGPSRGAPVQPPGPNTQPTAADPGVFSLYNWKTGAWEPLPAGDELTRVADAGRYISPDGQIRLQVTAETDKYIRYLLPEVTVEGVVD